MPTGWVLSSFQGDTRTHQRLWPSACECTQERRSASPLMEVRVHTIADVDEALDRVRTAYLKAEEDCDLETAGKHYALLDKLLDERLHIPAQR